MFEPNYQAIQRDLSPDTLNFLDVIIERIERMHSIEVELIQLRKLNRALANLVVDKIEEE